jgi:putative membrane protein
MELISKLLVGIVALEHLGFLYLEMFLWTTPRGLRAFGMTREQAEASKMLAANQGLYNGFLAVGLLWSIVHPNETFAPQLAGFLLGCVIVAAIFGAATAKRSILIIQGLPALLALLSVILL